MKQMQLQSCKNKLYHITERTNLVSILQRGLTPRYDTTLRAKGLDKATLVNLGERKVIEEVLWEEPWTDPVLLGVDVPKKHLIELHHVTEDIIWYGSEKVISPASIEVIGSPTKLLGYSNWRDALPNPIVGLSSTEIEEEKRLIK